MKPKTVFTVIFSITVLFSAGQTIHETFRFAEKQFETGNFHAALTEYQRVAFFDSENQFQNIYQKIGDLFFATGEYSAAIRNYDIASRIAKNDSMKTVIILKKTLCHFKQNNYFFALNELMALPTQQNFRLQYHSSLYKAVAWFGIEEYEEAFNSLCTILPEEEISKLVEIFDQFEKTRKRYSPGKIETISILFPGLGQIYCGNIAGGLNSVALTGSIAVIAVLIWQAYGILDALLSVSSWYYRYYTGGIKNAKSAAMEKISIEREETYNQIIHLVENNLIQYP